MVWERALVPVDAAESRWLRGAWVVEGEPQLQTSSTWMGWEVGGIFAQVLELSPCGQ